MAQRNIKFGDVFTQSGEVNIAGGDIYKEFTVDRVSALLTQNKEEFQPKAYVRKHFRHTMCGTWHARLQTFSMWLWRPLEVHWPG